MGIVGRLRPRCCRVPDVSPFPTPPFLSPFPVMRVSLSERTHARTKRSACLPVRAFPPPPPQCPQPPRPRFCRITRQPAVSGWDCGAIRQRWRLHLPVGWAPASRHRADQPGSVGHVSWRRAAPPAMPWTCLRRAASHAAGIARGGSYSRAKTCRREKTPFLTRSRLARRPPSAAPRPRVPPVHYPSLDAAAGLDEGKEQTVVVCRRWRTMLGRARARARGTHRPTSCPGEREARARP